MVRILENQLKKNTEDEMGTGLLAGFTGIAGMGPDTSNQNMVSLCVMWLVMYTMQDY